MTELERIESELREIKAILMILVPSYGKIEREAESIFGWIEGKPCDTVSHAKRGRNNRKGDQAGTP